MAVKVELDIYVKPGQPRQEMFSYEGNDIREAEKLIKKILVKLGYAYKEGA